MNGTYHHGPAPVLALTFPAFHPPFRRLNTHLPYPHSFFDSNTCIIWPHISLSVITPKTVYYLINIVVKTQTSPRASSITDLLNGMCLWATSLTSCLRSSHDLYHFNVSLPLPCRSLLRHVSQDAMHPSLITQILNPMLRECHYA